MTKKAMLALLLGIAATSGCSGRPEEKSGFTKSTISGSAWEPKASDVERLDKDRKVLAGQASVRAPKGYILQEETSVSDPVATFKDGPNSIEIMKVNGVPNRVKLTEFAGTTRTMLTNSSRLHGVEASDIECGLFASMSATRFRYKGKDAEGRLVEGVYYLCLPEGSAAIWNLVAEGTPETLPLLEAAALTVKWGR